MDFGLLSGLAEGIKQGTQSYSAARQNRLAEEEALERRKQASAQLAQTQSNQDRQFGLEQEKFKAEGLLARDKMAQDLKIKQMEMSKAKTMDPKAALDFNEASKKANDPYNRLPKADQMVADEEIKLYTKRQGAVDKLGGAVSQLEDPNIPEDQKVIIGEGILKMLNDPEMSDAVGADEAKRIGAYLQQFSLTRPGSTFGRDLPRFTSQVKNKLDLSKKTQGDSKARLQQKGLLTDGLLQAKESRLIPDAKSDEDELMALKAMKNQQKVAR